MGYDRGDSFPLDFEHKWMSICFRKSKRKLSPRSYPIKCERNRKYSFLSMSDLHSLSDDYEFNSASYKKLFNSGLIYSSKEAIHEAFTSITSVMGIFFPPVYTRRICFLIHFELKGIRLWRQLSF